MILHHSINMHIVYVNDIILFFGGTSYCTISNSVFKYSIQENEWMKYENVLPNPLYNHVAVLSEDNINIHIIGGNNDKKITLSTHMKTKVCAWDNSPLVLIYLFYFSKNEIKFVIRCWNRILKIRLGWIDDFDKLFSNILDTDNNNR
ncbi:hypothetical protein RFI_30997 [Reticulomyxa filosa]|uniref:Kelch-like protein n=1 Tax=Reticulomyxa filosa TaxID=46433 RepID=X6LXT1_RETFI|nr:hypothetical protein RFI_30997 [Reticulomyxa filosa]|eukprot:ETO06399.1 hypothetical protein RFI_30997 [Reticulomyxa filosa]